MKNYYAILFSFDGEYQKESPQFDEISKVWDYINDLGSKWYFYPFCFVASGKTIADTPDLLPGLIGKRITTIKKLFIKTFKNCKDEEADYYDFCYLLTSNLHEKDYLEAI